MRLSVEYFTCISSLNVYDNFRQKWGRLASGGNCAKKSRIQKFYIQNFKQITAIPSGFVPFCLDSLGISRSIFFSTHCETVLSAFSKVESIKFLIFYILR